MKKKQNNSRRSFLKKLGTSAAAVAAAPAVIAQTPYENIEYLHLVKKKAIAANDKIRIALIGTGGHGDR